MGLPVRYRLRRRAEIDRVRQSGQRFDSGPFIMRTAPGASDAEHPRFVIVTSRRVGNAVVRNRARRVMREVIRKNLDALPHPLDVMIVVRTRFHNYSFAALTEAFLCGCRRFAPPGNA